MALTSRQRSIHNKNNTKRSSFNKGKRKASEGDIIITSAPTDLRKIWYPRGALALSLLLGARILAVYIGHIGDCDETYNYWEPLHYLIYGRGLQTWEYSPDYAIRSYAFLWIFALPGKMLSFFMEPVTVFYTLRTLIAILTAVVELGFYKAVCHEFGVHVGRVWLACTLPAAGAGAVAGSLLPAALGGSLAAAALACCWRRRYAPAVALTALNVLLGWPFTAILGLPIAIDMIFLKQQYSEFMKYSLISLVAILVPTVAIDSWYYGKLVIAPLNIVMYNVFSEHGPSLYGVEPWTYYFVNGFLNFNIVWVAALATPAALCWCSAADARSTVRGPFVLPYWLDLLPLYLWLLIFVLQPHKEERFLYPVYPLVTLAAAVTVDCAQKALYAHVFLPRHSPSPAPSAAPAPSPAPRHYLASTVPVVALFVLVSALMGISRTTALYRNYHAPMVIFKGLPPLDGGEQTVCFGKEWHRSPSTFLLPRGYDVRFIASDFNGQMPAPYARDYNASRVSAAHFNDANVGDARTYLKPSRCHYLVQSDVGAASALQPAYYRDAAVWALAARAQLLDAARSPRLLRAFYLPRLSDRHTHFGTLYLLRNRFL